MSSMMKFVVRDFHDEEVLHVTCGRPMYSIDGDLQVRYCSHCHVFDTESISALNAITVWIRDQMRTTDDEWKCEDTPSLSERTRSAENPELGFTWERLWHFSGTAINGSERSLFVGLLADGSYRIALDPTPIDDEWDEEDEPEEETQG